MWKEVIPFIVKYYHIFELLFTPSNYQITNLKNILVKFEIKIYLRESKGKNNNSKNPKL